MCWKSKVLPKMEIAEKDFETIKIGRCYFPHSKAVESMVQRFIYRINNLYELKKRLKVLLDSYNNVYEIYEGFHSYNAEMLTFTYIEGTKMKGYHFYINPQIQINTLSGSTIDCVGFNHTVLVKCIIPKGASYYNNGTTLVSDKIILKEVCTLESIFNIE